MNTGQRVKIHERGKPYDGRTGTIQKRHRNGSMISNTILLDRPLKFRGSDVEHHTVVVTSSRLRRINRPRKNKMRLTSADIRRHDTLDYVMAYKRENDGLSPSYAEIMANVGTSSKSVVSSDMKALVADGKVRLMGQRGIVVVGGAWTAPGEALM